MLHHNSIQDNPNRLVNYHGIDEVLIIIDQMWPRVAEHSDHNFCMTFKEFFTSAWSKMCIVVWFKLSQILTEPM